MANVKHAIPQQSSGGGSGVVGGRKKMLEQMPGAKTLRRKPEHITVHQVNDCTLGPYLSHSSTLLLQER